MLDLGSNRIGTTKVIYLPVSTHVLTLTSFTSQINRFTELAHHLSSQCRSRRTNPPFRLSITPEHQLSGCLEEEVAKHSEAVGEEREIPAAEERTTRMHGWEEGEGNRDTTMIKEEEEAEVDGDSAGRTMISLNAIGTLR